MRKILVVALSAIALVAMGSQAQNARLNAMGNYYLFGDVSDILLNPAYINSYKDLIQGTYSNTPAGGMAEVIGVKGLGEKLALGVTYNPAALHAAEAVPHVLVASGTDLWNLGLELYYEREWERSEETNVAPGNTAITNSEDISSYLGAMLGLTLDLDAVALGVAVGIALPYDKAYSYTETTALGSTEVTTKLQGNIDLEGYVDAAFEVGDYAPTIGLYGDVSLYGKTETETISKPAGGPNATNTVPGGTDDLDLTLGLYAGVNREWEDYGLKVGGLVDVSWLMTRTQPIDMTSGNYNPGKVWDNALALQATLAAEKEWKSLKRLDGICARTGLTYGITEVVTHHEGDTSGLSHELRLKNAAARNPEGFGWTLGAGLEKGIMTFDVDVSPTAVVESFDYANGQFAAQDLVSVTLTLDFKKIGSRSSGSSSSEAPAAPAAAPEGGLSF